MFGIGPLLILDKSVLQMLSGDEFSLLTEYFRLVVPPVLTEEIIADLELKPTERTIPEVVVGRLASRMAEACGDEPVHYAQAVGQSLLGGDVPMYGSVPIGNRPNAYHTDDGEGFIYDKVPEQQFWQRLAAGQFEPQDKERAQRWRQDISASTSENFIETCQAKRGRRWARSPRATRLYASSMPVWMMLESRTSS
jgi:hypothetical protein